MSAQKILKELESLGTEQTKKVLRRHGAREPFFGVKVGDLKKIQKRVKVDHELALALYDTGNSDAMYLAGLIADDPKMSKKDLNRWVKAAYWPMLSEAIVAWVAAGGLHGWELGLEWIESKHEHIAAAGWSTLGSLVSVKADAELDTAALGALLDRVGTSIHGAPNRVRYAMNGFVIAVGSYVAPLTAAALRVAKKIGPVSVEMGQTECHVPLAADYIEKVKKLGRIGKKRKTAKC